MTLRFGFDCKMDFVITSRDPSASPQDDVEKTGGPQLTILKLFGSCLLK